MLGQIYFRSLILASTNSSEMAATTDIRFSIFGLTNTTFVHQNYEVSLQKFCSLYITGFKACDLKGKPEVEIISN